VAGERRIPIPVLRGTGPNGRIVEADVLGYAEQAEALRVTPTAREIALRRAVDLTKVAGTGIDGRITKLDVEMAPPAPGTPPSGKRVPLTSMRRIVADRMTLSKTTTPHFYLTIDVDMSKAVLLRRELMALWSSKVTFNDLLIRGCTLAFQAVPEMNCIQDGDGLIWLDEVNIGLAVAIDGGLVVPVVRRCDLRSVEQISHETARLIERARNKHLTPDDYEGGCFTISNLGMFCIETVTPIINPGEVAILGVGRIAPRPVVVGDGIAIRRMTTLTLACDHRLVDGATGARFLKKLKEVLELPERLL
jgi:pyruvate dehydrogenase E2 component (dihydrolipoamide acetyltransferase)